MYAATKTIPLRNRTIPPVLRSMQTSNNMAAFMKHHRCQGYDLLDEVSECSGERQEVLRRMQYLNTFSEYFVQYSFRQFGQRSEKMFLDAVFDRTLADRSWASTVKGENRLCRETIHIPRIRWYLWYDKSLGQKHVFCLDTLYREGAIILTCLLGCDVQRFHLLITFINNIIPCGWCSATFTRCFVAFGTRNMASTWRHKSVYVSRVIKFPNIWRNRQLLIWK